MSDAYCQIVTSAIDIDSLVRRVSGFENGAAVTFVGQTRNVSRGREVTYLEYDAYAPMAVKQMQRIAADACQRWGVKVAMEHRIGRLGLGEASIVICVGSPHRAPAFEACQFCIDTLKQDVPIWKKEVCADGAFWIEGEDAVPSK